MKLKTLAISKILAAAFFGVAAPGGAAAQVCTTFDDGDLAGFEGLNAAARICNQAGQSDHPACLDPGGSGGPYPDGAYLQTADQSGGSGVTFTAPEDTRPGGEDGGAGGGEAEGHDDALFTGDLSNACELSYDVRMFRDNGNIANTAVPWAPIFAISDSPGVNTGIGAIFRASFTITEDGGPDEGWHNVSVPIGPSVAGAPPTGPDGSWEIRNNGSASANPGADWDALIANVAWLRWPTDINSATTSGGPPSSGPHEVFGYDNFCRVACAPEPCTPEFELTKTPIPGKCDISGSGLCSFEIEVTNTADCPFEGVITITDTADLSPWLAAGVGSASFGPTLFDTPEPWSCSAIEAGEISCDADVSLPPGGSESLTVTLGAVGAGKALPADLPAIENCAALNTPFAPALAGDCAVAEPD